MEVASKGWVVKPLEDIVTTISSGTSSTKDSGVGYPIYGSTGQIGNSSTFDYVGEKVLVARVGANAGKVSFVNGKYCVSDNTLIVDLKDGVNNKYIYYYLVNQNLNRLVFGSGQPLVTGSQLKKLDIKIPEQETEQAQVVESLEDIHNYITTLDKFIEKKKKVKIATMQQLLSGKVRLSGFTKEWESIALGLLLAYEQPTKYIVKSTDYLETGNVPVLTAGKTHILGYTRETEGVYTNLPCILFDDFTTESRYIDYNFKVKSSATKLLTTRSETENLKYIFLQMQMIGYKPSDHKRHWISEYQNFQIPLPSPEEQEQLVSVFFDMDKEIIALQKKRSKLIKMKAGAMHELLTGNIRLV